MLNMNVGLSSDVRSIHSAGCHVDLWKKHICRYTKINLFFSFLSFSTVFLGRQTPEKKQKEKDCDEHDRMNK